MKRKKDISTKLLTIQEASRLLNGTKPLPSKNNSKIQEDVGLFKAIVQSTDDAIIGKTLDGTITSWNNAAERLYGYNSSEMIGKPITILFPPEKKKEFSLIMAKIKKGKTIDNFETTRVKKNGEIIIVSITVSPIKDSSRKIIGASSIARDITAHKILEERLLFMYKASRLFSYSLDYKTTLNTIADLAVPGIADFCEIYMIDEEKKVRNSITLLNDPKKTKLIKRFYKLNPSDMDETSGISQVLRNGKSELYKTISNENNNIKIKSKKFLDLIGKIGVISLMIVPLTVKHKVIGAIKFASIESGRHYTKDDLYVAEELANRAALAIENSRLYSVSQKAIKLRDEFISIASHELKTPVTSLKIYTQVLKDQYIKTHKDQRKIRYFLKIENQIEKLAVLIKDLLDISKIESGRLEIKPETFDINELVKENVEAVGQTTKKHKIKIKGIITKKVWGDKYQIGQVIINLLTNAIKYSPNSNAIIVYLTEQKNKISVGVKDFGIGISKKYQGKIFDRFYRVSENADKTFPGLGMGLYISNQIIKHHKGEMGVLSEKGKGSLFSFVIPTKTEKSF